LSADEIINELTSTMKENPASTTELFNHLRECNDCRTKWLLMVEDVRKHIKDISEEK